MKSDAVYILDHTAIEALWGFRDGREIIEDIFQQSKNLHIEIYVTAIDLGKAYKKMVLEYNKKAAQKALEQLEDSPVKVVVINKKIAVEAMEIAMEYNLDYADAFACAMSVINEGTIVTANPSLVPVQEELELLWLDKTKK